MCHADALIISELSVASFEVRKSPVPVGAVILASASKPLDD